jgi:hypothetical protein
MSEYEHQEPIFKSTEGKDVTPWSKKNEPNEKGEIHETTPPSLESLNKTSELDHDEKRDLALARIETVTSKEQVDEIIKDYNAQFEKTNDMAVHMHTVKLGEIILDGKEYVLSEIKGGTKGLMVFEKEPFPSESQIQKATTEITADKQLRGILASIVRGNFNQRDSLSDQDVRDFYKKFDSIDTYFKSGMIGELLKEIEFSNGKEKIREYESKAMQFAGIMFPGQ